MSPDTFDRGSDLPDSGAFEQESAPDYAQPAVPRPVAPSPGDVHVNLGQSFMPREPTYERIKLTWYGLIIQKWNKFGYRHYGYGEESTDAYKHMENELRAFMLTTASQVPRSRWPDVREQVMEWWRRVKVDFEMENHIPLAMAEIENIMYEVGLGLRRVPQPTKWNLSRADNDALWLVRLRKDRDRKLAEVAAR